MRRQWIWILAAVVIGDCVVAYWWFARRGEARYDSEIRRAALRYDVDPALVKAVIWRESRFNPNARGRAGELGLMQVRNLAATEWAQSKRMENFAHETLIHPSSNTLAGTWYLGKLLKRYKETDSALPYALADYNAGRKHVLRWMKGDATTNSGAFTERIDFPTTRQYISDVLERYGHYKR